MKSMLTTSLLAAVAAFALSTSPARADETVIEKHTYESERHAVEVVPPAEKRVVEEHTVTKEVPAVQKRTDTVTTTTEHDHDNDDDNDND
jgi:hypothetical protein